MYFKIELSLTDLINFLKDHDAISCTDLSLFLSMSPWDLYSHVPEFILKYSKYMSSQWKQKGVPERDRSLKGWGSGKEMCTMEYMCHE